jgi:hypothetical protein
MSTFGPRGCIGCCYELAWKYQAKDERFADWLLVHGEVNGAEGRRTGHAWLERGASIFDPVSNVTLPAASYYGQHDARSFETYDQTEAASAALLHGHLGPWHSPAAPERP